MYSLPKTITLRRPTSQFFGTEVYDQAIGKKAESAKHQSKLCERVLRFVSRLIKGNSYFNASFGISIVFHIILHLGIGKKCTCTY